MKQFRLLIAATVALFAATAQANTVVPGEYFLIDHGNGNLGSNYGLRLDILDPPAGAGPTFSVSSGDARVTLSWDGSGTAVIQGVMVNNETGNLWTVTHTLTGITATSDGFIASFGEMTVGVAAEDQDLYGASVYTFFSVPSGQDAFVAAGDDHRCGSDPDCGPLVARGWLNIEGVDTRQNDGSTEDWLVQLRPVPLPAAVWMLLAGLGMFGAARRAR